MNKQRLTFIMSTTRGGADTNPSSSPPPPPPQDDLHHLIAEERRQLMDAQSLDFDLNYAFHLQLQEALAASLASHPSTSSPPPQPSPSLNDIVFSLADEQLSILEQEIIDRELTRREIRNTMEDLQRRIHDQNLATEIARISEEEWNEWGDNYEKSFGEGSSNGDSDIFRVYFKGMVSVEGIGEKKEETVLAGIGVAICDPKDNLIFEIKKPLIGNGMSRTAAEAKALIDGLEAALSLDLKRVDFYCDYFPIYQFVTGRWPPKQHKIAVLVNQVSLLQRKFTYCNPVLMARNEIKYAFKFAREAIVAQIFGQTDSSRGKTPHETCVICLEDIDVSHIFSVNGCLHRYCFSCMRQHVQVKLLHGIMPKCPHQGCESELTVESCKIFLTPKLIETMNLRKQEASIPITEKVYCPYPRCSALMSKSEICYNGAKVAVGVRNCLKCHGLFCIYCRVPWHSNMTCLDYKRMNPNPPAEVVKLKYLATRNLWRQCIKCNHLIELSEGCYHMTCRCGYEFCYNCGAVWINKKATCSCPLWNEAYIVRDEFGEEEEDDF
ncbi:IBR domain-containing protein/RVT_3 domain-containing protein [Cephalotus follicularis]|uniref:RBR-type E3 ubiquitin transferase n=1 Tax=Cephalotus follicularis TaxID=3775 RepID=A0A1Q3B2A2_CEPFO|nr:IBR domain-containing protein/RVT_3 domain-containing protein [Cephalotus follicularis]